MSVAELIRQLSGYPAHARVYVGMLEPSVVVNVIDAYDEDLKEPMVIIEADDPS